MLMLDHSPCMEALIMLWLSWARAGERTATDPFWFYLPLVFSIFSVAHDSRVDRFDSSVHSGVPAPRTPPVAPPLPSPSTRTAVPLQPPLPSPSARTAAPLPPPFVVDLVSDPATSFPPPPARASAWLPVPDPSPPAPALDVPRPRSNPRPELVPCRQLSIFPSQSRLGMETHSRRWRSAAPGS